MSCHLILFYMEVIAFYATNKTSSLSIKHSVLSHYAEWVPRDREVFFMTTFTLRLCAHFLVCFAMQKGLLYLNYPLKQLISA